MRRSPRNVAIAFKTSKRFGLRTHSELSDSKIASRLKQALQVRAENAVKLRGQRDGYFGKTKPSKSDLSLCHRLKDAHVIRCRAINRIVMAVSGQRGRQPLIIFSCACDCAR